MPRFLLLLAMTALLGGVLADRDLRGVRRAPALSTRTLECPEPSTMTGFDLQRYLGKWYEMKRVPRGFERDGTCGTAEYSWEDDTHAAVNVVNRNYMPSSREYYTVNLRAAPRSQAEASQGKFVVTFPSQPVVPESNYWVVDTDYDTYSVVYSCSPAAPSITLWAMARDPAKFNADLEKKISQILEERGLFPSLLESVEQQICPASTCAPCTRTQANLNVDKLSASRWWEVLHSPYASGAVNRSCGFADFSSTTDGIQLKITSYDASKQQESSLALQAKWTDPNAKSGDFTTVTDTNGALCVIEADADYSDYVVLSACVEQGDGKAAAGGAYVLARQRGLSAADQMKANQALVSAGFPSARMISTESTPCPASAFTSASSAPAHSLWAAVVVALLVLTSVNSS